MLSNPCTGKFIETRVTSILATYVIKKSSEENIFHVYEGILLSHTLDFKRKHELHRQTVTSVVREFFSSGGQCKMALHMDSDNEVGTKGKTFDHVSKNLVVFFFLSC